ncbi:H-NS histone family protein [Paraburkholderia sp. DHOC27]|nr:H-NS histone family protein [Paraburkholderia sp. DHOC27]
MDEMKRDRIVAYLRHRMEEFGIKPEDLAPDAEPKTSTPSKAQGADRYRSANGDRWDGEGEMPEWLRRAISAGQSIDHFEVAPPVQHAHAGR